MLGFSAFFRSGLFIHYSSCWLPNQRQRFWISFRVELMSWDILSGAARSLSGFILLLLLLRRRLLDVRRLPCASMLSGSGPYIVYIRINNCIAAACEVSHLLRLFAAQFLRVTNGCTAYHRFLKLFRQSTSDVLMVWPECLQWGYCCDSRRSHMRSNVKITDVNRTFLRQRPRRF